jgi:hypothetical protein
MRSKRHYLAIGFLALACACQSAGGVVDQRPEFIAKRQLRSTVWLGLSENGKNITGMGSAVIVGPNRLLTNAHVWSADDPWWGSDLREEAFLFLCKRGQKHVVMIGHDQGHQEAGSGDIQFAELPNKLVKTKFRLVAHADTSIVKSDVVELLHGEVAQQSRPPMLWSKDWVVIETDRPTWQPADAAILHPAAMALDWLPARGTDAFIAGFSSVFVKGSKVEGEFSLRGLHSFIEEGPYVLSGKVLHVEESYATDKAKSQPMVSYLYDWPSPGGHSGGGVYLWNATSRQPELIGVFHTHNATTSLARFMGLGLFEVDAWSLGYTPLGFLLDDLP